MSGSGVFCTGHQSQIFLKLELLSLPHLLNNADFLCSDYFVKEKKPQKLTQPQQHGKVNKILNILVYV